MTEIYAGRVVTLRLALVQTQNGRVVQREIVEHAPGAAIVAVEQDGQVLLVRQPRPAVGASILELPAGLVDEGETPIECARRELAEETGYRAGHLEPLVEFYTSPGFCTERIHVFVANDLEPVDVAHDEEEEIELIRLPIAVALERVLTQEVSDAKTITGLLAYYRMSSGRSTISR